MGIGPNEVLETCLARLQPKQRLWGWGKWLNSNRWSIRLPPKSESRSPCFEDGPEIALVCYGVLVSCISQESPWKCCSAAWRSQRASHGEVLPVVKTRQRRHGCAFGFTLQHTTETANPSSIRKQGNARMTCCEGPNSSQSGFVIYWELWGRRCLLVKLWKTYQHGLQKRARIWTSPTWESQDCRWWAFKTWPLS